MIGHPVRGAATLLRFTLPALAALGLATPTRVWARPPDCTFVECRFDSIALSPVWTAEGNQVGAGLGASVSSAGDVNGDGIPDVIVGARRHDASWTDEGRACIYLGSASALAATPVWSVEGGQGFAFLGSSVASAGDVNGDGFGDVIVGSPGYDGFHRDEGQALVYLGSPSGPSTAPSWSASGVRAFEFLGSSVSLAGDVNGDGYSDVIVGAPLASKGIDGEGEVHLFLGSPHGPSMRPEWSAQGGQRGAQLGCAVATSGDVNGDGFDDVIAGAPYWSGEHTHEGRAVLYLGSSAGLSKAPAWSAQGGKDHAFFGTSVTRAGDVNGDGYDDVSIGAPGNAGGDVIQGHVQIFFGSRSGLGPEPSQTLAQGEADAQFGWSVASAGDLNCDRYDDILIGAYLHSHGDSYGGRTYAFLGSPSGLAPRAAWIAEVDREEAAFGFSVASAGDLNGDGREDWIAGADGYSKGETGEGAIFLFLGCSPEGAGTDEPKVLE